MKKQNIWFCQSCQTIAKDIKSKKYKCMVPEFFCFDNCPVIGLGVWMSKIIFLGCQKTFFRIFIALLKSYH